MRPVGRRRNACVHDDRVDSTETLRHLIQPVGHGAGVADVARDRHDLCRQPRRQFLERRFIRASSPSGAPASANERARAAPMPRLAPVMTIVRWSIPKSMVGPYPRRCRAVD